MTLDRPAPVPAIPTAARSDATALRAAALAAVGLHVAVLLVPLRVARPAPPAPAERVPPARVHVWRPPAPDIPARELAPPVEVVRRLPIPARAPERLADPVPEAIAPPAIRPPAAFDPGVVPDGPPPATPPRVLDEGEPGVEAPIRLPGGAEPAYPPIAVRAGAGGEVVLRAVIDESGRVVDVAVLRAPLPDLGFSQAAIAAVETWRYRPGLWRGRPTAVRMTVLVTFRLNR